MKKYSLLIISFMILGMIMVQPVTSSSTVNVPILQPKDVKTTFTPTAVGNNSYYIVKPDNYFPTPTYQSSVPAVFTRTDLGNNAYITPVSTSYNIGSTPDTSYTSVSKSGVQNTFTNKVYSVPQAVKIDNPNSTLVSKYTTPFSIHKDESTTFFGENGKSYYALLNQQGNVLLDLDVKDSNANVDFYVYKNNVLIQDNYGIQRASIPIFSSSANLLFVLQVNGANSLVTLVPHELKSTMYTSTNLQINTSSQFTVNQGQCYTSSSGSISGSQNLFQQINMLSLPVKQGNYYQIIFDNQSLDQNTSGCNNYGSINPYLLNMTNSGSQNDPFSSMTVAQYISGSLNSNSLTIKSLKTGSLQLTIDSIGHVHTDVTVFFRQITKPKPQYYEIPLTLNKASTIYNAYNTFTLNNSHMVAINYTQGSSYEYMNFYSLNTTNHVWNEINYLTSSSSPDLFNGNLLKTNSLSNLNPYDWFYLPAGTYAVRNNDLQNKNNLKFTINAVPIRNLSRTDSVTVNINNNSIYAFAPTSNNFEYQLLNLTSSTHDNVSVGYEYTVAGQYEQIYNTYSSTSLVGNRFQSGGWQAYSRNNTGIFSNFRYSDLWSPIVIVRPYTGYNTSSLSSISSYSTQLTVKTNIVTGNLFAGRYVDDTPVIPGTPTTLDTSKAGFSPSTGNTYQIPLSTEANTLYNLSIYTSGNTTTYLNLSLNSIATYGGSYSNLDSGFNDLTPPDNSTNSFMSQVILTQSNPSYLYFSFNKYNLNTNGTITILLTKITSKTLGFPNTLSFNNLIWNSTISKYEVSDSNTLFSIGPTNHSTPGFEMLAVVFGLVTVPALKKLKHKNKRL